MELKSKNRNVLTLINDLIKSVVSSMFSKFVEFNEKNTKLLTLPVLNALMNGRNCPLLKSLKAISTPTH